MITQDNAQTSVKPNLQPFNIITEFAGLSAKRKMSLFDHLMVGQEEAFAQTVSLIWPSFITTRAIFYKQLSFLSSWH